MAFIETPRFPDSVAFWAKGGPGYNTTIVVVNSGFEKRNINWQNARGRWDVSPGLMVQDAASAQVNAAQVIAFFRAMKGRGNGFRFKDFQDFDANVGGVGILSDVGTPTTSTGNGNGAATLQLYKTYTTGNLHDVRVIPKPVSAIVVSKNGMPMGGGSYSVDYTTGVVTFVAAYPLLTDVMTWSGTFDVPVRFDSDVMKGGPLGSMDGGGGALYTWEQINLVELRV